MIRCWRPGPAHELAVAQAMIGQGGIVARETDAGRVLVIHPGIGPLSGVEARLLELAFAGAGG